MNSQRRRKRQTRIHNVEDTEESIESGEDKDYCIIHVRTSKLIFVQFPTSLVQGLKSVFK